MLNTVALMGRLTKDPELRRTGSGKAVVSFGIAVNRHIGDGVDFFDCIAWEKTGEIVHDFFAKGKMIAIDGRLQTRTWEKDGHRMKAVEIVADHVHFCGSKTEENARNDSTPARPVNIEFTEEVDDDGHLPF